MTNQFYTTTGKPTAISRALSADLRTEFGLIQTAFDGVSDALDPTLVSGTSTTSLSIGTGPKTLTIQTDRSIFAGQTVVIAYTTAPATRMIGTVTSYDTATGSLVVQVSESYGSGTYAVWTVSYGVLPGDQLVDMPTGANIASAATLNLDAATGNRVHVTGTTTIIGVTLTRGPRTVIFDGALTLTHNATTNKLPGAVNITTAAGDIATYESDGTTVYCTSYTRANGASLGAGDHAVAVTTPNGWGSTNTKIARFTTVQSSTGTDITYADSATLGASFTTNRAGLYQVYLNGPFGATAALKIGASVNTTTPTTDLDSITASSRILYGQWDNSVNQGWSLSRVMYFNAGDVIRPHGNGANLGTSPIAVFAVRKVGT
jgi:hypothetical protein